MSISCLMLMWRIKCWFQNDQLHSCRGVRYVNTQAAAGVFTHKPLCRGSMFSHTNTHGLEEVSFQSFSNMKPNWNYWYAHTHSLSLKICWCLSLQQTFVWCMHSLFDCLSSVCRCSIYSHFEQADIGVVCLQSADILFIRAAVTLTSPHIQDASTH